MARLDNAILDDRESEILLLIKQRLLVLSTAL